MNFISVLKKQPNEKRNECSNQAQEKEKKFKCEMCSNYYGSLNILKAHIKIVHNKLNVCHCPICSKQLTTKKNLKVHIKNVHGRENFKCGSCNRCFTSELILRKHRTTAHSNQTEIKCKICNFNYTCRKTLNAHIKQVHDKIREHVCAVCNKAFPTRSKLRWHTNGVHMKLKNFECVLCKKRLGYKDSFNLLMKNFHANWYKPC